MNYSPIALFIYKRPEHTRRTLESLMQCPEFADSPLYVFCDGAKKEKDQEQVMQAREVVRSLVGTKAKIIESTTNRGLANSIISGVTSLCDQYQRVIVVEDDLVVAPQFLSFLNAALEKYNNEPSVMQISGYILPVSQFSERNKAIFLPFTTSWGWATWKRAWDCFDIDASDWEILISDNALRSRFNLDGSYNYFNLLVSQMSGEVDSWAVRWYFSVFKQNGYVLYPPLSYVDNAGLDGSGSHSSKFANLIFGHKPLKLSSTMFELPESISIDKCDLDLVRRKIYFSGYRLRHDLGFIKRKINRITNTLFNF